MTKDELKPLYSENEWKITNVKNIHRYEIYIHHKQFGCNICHQVKTENDECNTYENVLYPLFQWENIESIRKTTSLIES